MQRVTTKAGACEQTGSVLHNWQDRAILLRPVRCHSRQQRAQRDAGRRPRGPLPSSRSCWTPDWQTELPSTRIFADCSQRRCGTVPSNREGLSGLQIGRLRCITCICHATEWHLQVKRMGIPDSYRSRFLSFCFVWAIPILPAASAVARGEVLFCAETTSCSYRRCTLPRDDVIGSRCRVLFTMGKLAHVEGGAAVRLHAFGSSPRKCRSQPCAARSDNPRPDIFAAPRRRSPVYTPSKPLWIAIGLSLLLPS